MNVLSLSGMPPFVQRYLGEKGETVLVCERILRGGNNQAYRLRTENGSYFLKAYFRHPEDPRDRLRAEYNFLQFCGELRIGAVPRPLACDAVSGMALYSWIDGEPVRQPATAADVDAACALLRDLACCSSDARSARLAPAADACMEMRDHLLLAERRVAGLRAALDGCKAASLRGQARALLETRLVPALKAAERRARCFLEARQPVERRMLVSPSDFGFHNALRTRDGLVFVDFEYAGLDDPAKTVCDFLCQPEIPVPETVLPAVIAALNVFDGAALHERVTAFLPLHRITWCCILLNDFRRLDARRRAFANAGIAGEERLAGQLAKARHYIAAWCRP